MDICRTAPGRHLAAHTAARTAEAAAPPRPVCRHAERGGHDAHILVTGAAGFIGSHLCEALLEQGHVVRGLDAFTTFYDPQRKRGNLERALAHPSFTLVTGDLLTAPLDEALDGVEWVAHLAGEPGVSTSWGPSFARYVDRNVLAAAPAGGGGRERRPAPGLRVQLLGLRREADALRARASHAPTARMA